MQKDQLIIGMYILCLALALPAYPFQSPEHHHDSQEIEKNHIDLRERNSSMGKHTHRSRKRSRPSGSEPDTTDQNASPYRHKKGKFGKQGQPEPEDVEDGPSLEEEWHTVAKKVAATWGQSLEEFIQDAHKFLGEFQKLYPHERLPSITDLMMYPRPKQMPKGYTSLTYKFSIPLR